MRWNHRSFPKSRMKSYKGPRDWTTLSSNTKAAENHNEHMASTTRPHSPPWLNVNRGNFSSQRPRDMTTSGNYLTAPRDTPTLQTNLTPQTSDRSLTDDYNNSLIMSIIIGVVTNCSHERGMIRGPRQICDNAFCEHGIWGALLSSGTCTASYFILPVNLSLCVA